MPTQKLYFLKINLNSEIYDLFKLPTQKILTAP